jgi:hypothetical protein
MLWIMQEIKFKLSGVSWADGGKVDHFQVMGQAQKK